MFVHLRRKQGGGYSGVAVLELFVLICRTKRGGAVLRPGRLLYRSDERRFAEWGAGNARYFRAEMKLAQKLFVEALLQQLFDL